MGIIYNVTTKIDHAIAESWLQWMKEEHIPELIRTGCFTHAVILRLLEVDETDGLTYAVQYHATSKMAYNDYIQNYSVEIRNKSAGNWGGKAISFRSVMQVVD